MISVQLISYKEYCDIGLSTKGKPDIAEDLLTKFIERDNEQEFYHFLEVLDREPSYQQIARTLKRKAGEQARGEISEYQL